MNRRIRFGISLIGFLLLVCTFLPSAFSKDSLLKQTLSQTTTPPPLIPQESKRLWNLKDVDIKTFIHAVAESTGKNFIIDPRVDGKVTFISSKPLNGDELYQVFLSVLQVHGYAAVPAGSVVKIVPDASVKGLNSPIFTGRLSGQRDAVSVSVIDVKYVSANELATALKQFLIPPGQIVAYPSANDLIIADRSGNIEHMKQLIQQIDQPRSDKISMFRLNKAKAKDVLEVLKAVVTQTSDIPDRVLKLAADERTNSILMSGGYPSQILQVRTIIDGLDESNATNTDVTEVIYLKHLRSNRAAPIVKSLIEAELKGKRKDAEGSDSGSPDPAADQGATKAGSSLFGTHLGGSSGGAGGAAPGGLYNSNAPNNDMKEIVGDAPKSGSAGPYVQWEESTNSLVVTAPRYVIEKVKRVIARLDIRRQQVLIEAVIAEVSADREKELGIQLNTAGQVSFLTNFSPVLPLSSIGTNGNLSAGGVADTVGQGLSGTYEGNQIRFLVRALETDNESNVLATPNIVTLDNEPAQIKVGSKVSFATAQIQNSPTGGNPFNFFDREDVGLVLTISPQITSNGSITLVIQQEISTLLPNTAHAGGNPDTTERFVRTTVMADNGQVLVMAGLLQNQWNEVTSKVPVLGDIPGLGVLFRDRTKIAKKTNLMIFLRPTILYTEKDDKRVSGGKYEYLRQMQLQSDSQNPLKDSYEAPVLPVENKELALPAPFPVVSTKSRKGSF